MLSPPPRDLQILGIVQLGGVLVLLLPFGGCNDLVQKKEIYIFIHIPITPITPLYRYPYNPIPIPISLEP